MGAINLDNTGSGGAITLSSDGTSLLLGGTAIGGGGADLYAANEVSVTTQPSATGDDAVAIGDSASASAANSFAMGHSASASAGYSIALGRNASATGSNGAAVGFNTTAGTQAIALGNGAVASGNNSIAGPGGTASGINSNAFGSGAEASNLGGAAFGRYATTAVNNYNVAIGNSYASGAEALAAAIANRTASYGATGANSIAIGNLAKSTNTQSLAISGNTTTASGIQATSIGGENNTASGTRATALGGSTNYATGQESYAFGNRASAKEVGKHSYGGYFGFSGTFAGGFGVGGSQGGMMILGAATTDATPTVLRSNTSAAGSTNQLVAFTDTAITFEGSVTGIQNGAQAFASFLISGLLVNDGGTTTLVNSATTVIDNQSSWALALSADNTNNALAITVTGEASHNIRWVANIRTSEVTYA